MTRRTVIRRQLAIIAALTAGMGIAAAQPADAATLETSRAVARACPDSCGDLVIKTKYRTSGALVKPVKVCVIDRDRAWRTARVTWRQAWRQTYLGEFTEDRQCRRLPLDLRQWSRAYTWDSWGRLVAGPRIAGVDFLPADFHVKGRMRP